MSEVLGSNLTVAPPRLYGGFLPALDLSGLPDGLGLNVPWGSGAIEHRPMPLGTSLEMLQPGQVAGGFAGSGMVFVSAPMTVNNITIEGMVGPQGPPGPPGPSTPLLPGSFNLSGEQPVNTGAGTTSTLSVDVPLAQNIAWASNSPGAGFVEWSAGTLVFKGSTYNIYTGSTDSKYIYWDFADPSVFQNTNTLATAIGSGKWLMAYNDGGTAYPAYQSKVIHGGLIQASTITAANIMTDTITADRFLYKTGTNIFEGIAVKDTVGAYGSPTNVSGSTSSATWVYVPITSYASFSSVIQPANINGTITGTAGSWGWTPRAEAKAYIQKQSDSSYVWFGPLAQVIYSGGEATYDATVCPASLLGTGVNFRVGIAVRQTKGDALQGTCDYDINARLGTVTDAEVLKKK